MRTQPAEVVSEMRPWGRWTVLDEAPGYKIKRIEVLPGHRLSLQVHAARGEHWVVAQGVALVTRNQKSFTVRMRDATFVAPGVPHRLANPDPEKLLVVIEVQTGDYLGEDDIVRLEDDYGRETLAPRQALGLAGA